MKALDAASGGSELSDKVCETGEAPERLKSNVHSLSITASPAPWAVGELECVPALSEQSWGYTPDKSPVHQNRESDKHPNSHLQTLFVPSRLLPCKSFACERKLEYPRAPTQ